MQYTIYLLLYNLCFIPNSPRGVGIYREREGKEPEERGAVGQEKAVSSSSPARPSPPSLALLSPPSPAHLAHYSPETPWSLTGLCTLSPTPCWVHDVCSIYVSWIDLSQGKNLHWTRKARCLLISSKPVLYGHISEPMQEASLQGCRSHAQKLEGS